MGRALWASDQAVSRFRDLFCPGFGYAHARRELVTLCEQARRTPERVGAGEEVWRTGTSDEVCLIVRRPSPGARELPTVVTVMRDGDRAIIPSCA